MVVMPSGIRQRTSRVFGVVKNDRFQGVIRSRGQNGIVNCKAWSPHEAKLKKVESLVTVSEEPKRVSSNNRNKRVKSENRSKRVRSESRVGNDGEAERERRMFGNVYTRKRRRVEGGKSESFNDKMFGIRFSRRQSRKKVEDGEKSWGLVGSVGGRCCDCVFEGLVMSILRYMRRVGSVRLGDLAAFLCSEPICSVLAANGIRFLLDSTTNKIGVCKIFGMGQYVPMLSADFSAAPSCFTSMHLSLYFRVKFLSCLPEISQLDVDDMSSESDEDTSSETKTSSAGNFELKVVPQPSARVTRLSGRNAQYRNGLVSRGIQKRRRSFRRRARIPSLVGVQRADGALVSDLITSRKNGIPFSTVVSKNKLNSSAKSSPVSNNKKVTSPVFGVARDVDSMTQDVDMSTCSANLLVIEADRCYRVQWVTIALEMLDSGEWVLAVKKNGSTRYSHVAQKHIRTHSSNRVTHDIIWTADDNWKLEFSNKQDWYIFKELYKDCYDRNAPVPNPKTIPVPGVREVSGYEDAKTALFTRPEAYITVYNDEVARALAKRTANYDVDSEDEEWLRKFNDDSSIEAEHQRHLSEDNFELMIDRFEKALYCTPDDFTDEGKVVNLFLDLGRKEVIETVFCYWMKKRKQKGSSLLGVFQGHQPKETSLIPIPGLKKRRSFKRQVSQFGRGKQPNFLQVMAAEQDAMKEHSALLKVEEARNAALRSLEVAILKRRRAQKLMVNADLAAYKALMATRIAEAARLADPAEVAAHFLD